MNAQARSPPETRSSCRPRTIDLLRQRGLDLSSLSGNLVRDAAVCRHARLIGTVPVAQADGHCREFMLASCADAERVVQERLAMHDVKVERSTALVACDDVGPGAGQARSGRRCRAGNSAA